MASEYPNEVTREIIVPWSTLNSATENERNRRKDAMHCAIYGDVEPETKNQTVLLST